MSFCPSTSPFEFQDACVRASWSGLVPFVLVLFFLLRLALTHLFPRFTLISSLFQNFPTLAEAEALDYDDSKPKSPTVNDLNRMRPPKRSTFALIAGGLIEMGLWISAGAYHVTRYEDARGAILALVFASTWLYATLSPALNPTVGPPFDLFALYAFHLAGALLMLGGAIFDHTVYGDLLPPPLVLAGLTVNAVIPFGLFVHTLYRPLSEPLENISSNTTVSPKHYATLWSWMTISWVNPLIAKGSDETLKEDDVWNLNITVRARPVFRKFSTLDQRRSLLWKIWIANSGDLVLDFIGTLMSVVCDYLGPLFLKLIVDAIGNGRSIDIARAYLFAVLLFASKVLKTQSDVQHLWHSRRASVRIRSQLMSAIYDKALKRKDFSGIVNKEEKRSSNASEGSSAKMKHDKGNNLKKSADSGKILNLMAGDSNRIATTVTGLYYIYAAPFEIGIACIFLYQLLGVSAFAGIAIILLVWPINNYFARRAVRIEKGLLAARDERMSAVNELLSALKFIKFAAWENRWVVTSEECREKELEWLSKRRFNKVAIATVWSIAPVFISVLSFSAYVASGHELKVGTAFPAITLLSMIRKPVNVIPTWVVNILQARIALQRIASFLDEEEVGPQVSSIKDDANGELDGTTVLGLENASLKWNSARAKDESDITSKGKNKAAKGRTGSERSIEVTAADPIDSEVSLTGTEIEQDRIFELRDVSIIFPGEVLTVVTGPTASGKSALLLALLGEMTLTEGKLLMRKDPHKVYENGLSHSISYAAQTPWLQHRSIKENILFGSLFDPERYNSVLEACALRPDLAILEDGDETEIGVRGVTLSGGQKARVALARAVYARTKFVLLDDPLSAVDSHTASHLFRKLIMGPLMKDRTVILVTHHVELVLPGAFYFVRMLNGRIDVQGTVKDLRKSGVLAAETLVDSPEDESEDQVQKVGPQEHHASNASQTQCSPTVDDVGVEVQKMPRKLVKDEERQTGSVSWKIYRTYLEASTYRTWAVLLFLTLCVQALGFVNKYWIKVWGEAYEKGASTLFYHLFPPTLISEQHVLMPGVYSIDCRTDLCHESSSMSLGDMLPPAQKSPLFYVGIYTLIGVATLLVGTASSAMQYTSALYAARTLFSRLLRTVTQCTMRWLDTTPTGRVLNRFSKDIQTVDTSLAFSFQNVNKNVTALVTSLIVIISVFPQFIFPTLLMGYFYYKVAVAYLTTSRDLRRMESTARSPIFSEFGELLDGIVTVRAFSAEPRFMNGVYQKIDLTLKMFNQFWYSPSSLICVYHFLTLFASALHSSAYSTSYLRNANRWLLLRFDFLSALAVLIATIVALTSPTTNRHEWAGWAGLCITSAMQLSGDFYWTCRMWTFLEFDLNSVERIVEYLDLPQEPPAIIQNSRPPAHWPSSTGPNEDKLVEVKDLVVRYAPDLPAVLHDVSFTLRARERVGLLGRTGSGKSTLAMSLLRFTDPAQGQILIDGVDITTIGVNDLRSRLTFIPQDATLFSGTIRDNLDPFGDHSDLECLDALHRVQMISWDTLSSRNPPYTPSSLRNLLRDEMNKRAEYIPDSAGSVIVSPSSAASEVTLAGESENGQDEGQMKITLNTRVSSGGLNFSAGQRQLIAMARALLRRSAIVIMDEATSSIDFETDEKIQQAIRKEFSDSLLITIAHRLDTVTDYDRLIVLDDGHITEFDTPYNLLRKEGGIFRGMCMKSGKFSELEETAKVKAVSPSADTAHDE